jgi:hypothetical protein
MFRSIIKVAAASAISASCVGDVDGRYGRDGGGGGGGGGASGDSSPAFAATPMGPPPANIAGAPTNPPKTRNPRSRLPDQYGCANTYNPNVQFICRPD